MRGDRLANADRGLHERDAVGEMPVHRVVFHEVTPNVVREAMARPRGIDMDMVNAKQARHAARATTWRATLSRARPSLANVAPSPNSYQE